jgi:hypothetical protein
MLEQLNGTQAAVRGKEERTRNCGYAQPTPSPVVRTNRLE